MKPVKKIISLSVITFGIIAFWLVPGINKAEQTRYVRYYEDTEPHMVSLEAGKQLSDTTVKKRKKIYKKEIVEPRKEVNAKMFSRAVQFEPVLVNEDSVKEVQASAETAKTTKQK